MNDTTNLSLIALAYRAYDAARDLQLRLVAANIGASNLMDEALANAERAAALVRRLERI